MSTPVPIVASFVFTFDELKAARAFAGPRRLTMSVIFLLAILATVLLIGHQILTGRIRVAVAEWTPPKIALLIAACVGFYLYLRYQDNQASKQAFAQDVVSDKRIEYQISVDAIMSKVQGVSETRFEWGSFVHVRRTPKGFLFYQSPLVAIWIPEHAFASKQDVETVAALARERVAKYQQD